MLIRSLRPAAVLLAFAACDLDRGPVTPQLDEKDAVRGEGPSILYARFVRAVEAAESMEALAPYLELQVRVHVGHLSPKNQSEHLASAKRDEPEQVTVIRETVEGDLAMLRLAGVRAGRVVHGTATLVHEDRGWHVRDEAWEK